MNGKNLLLFKLIETHCFVVMSDGVVDYAVSVGFVVVAVGLVYGVA